MKEFLHYEKDDGSTHINLQKKKNEIKENWYIVEKELISERILISIRIFTLWESWLSRQIQRMWGTWSSPMPRGSGSIRDFLLQCRKLMAKPWEILLNHIYREANGAADALAKLGMQNQKRKNVIVAMFEKPTSSVHSVLSHDVLGSISRRIVSMGFHPSPCIGKKKMK